MTVCLTVAVGVVAGCSRRDTDVSVAFPAQTIDSPAGSGSEEPNLFAAADGRVYFSWIEPAGEGVALRFSVRTAGGWTVPVTVAEGDDWFVNWADFPSVVASPDGALTAHWLQKSGGDPYAYDTQMSRSVDAGKTWSAATKPHRDGTKTQHGFVSMLPWANGGVFITWLDGRNSVTTGGEHSDHESEEAPMTLRMALMDADGGLSEERVLDDRVCSCCQTSAALTTHGAIVVYRDRSPTEIRDIGIVRFRQGQWTEPRSLAQDGWELHGCPVNGPSIAARGERVAVAWFTAANDVAQVRVAFSTDEGATFGRPIRIDDGDPMGRVGVVLLADGSAVASWMEFADEGADIRARRVWPDARDEVTHTLASSSKERAAGFPVMASNEREILVAWTEVGAPSEVRTASLRLE
jgi:hypothetical protein